MIKLRKEYTCDFTGKKSFDEKKFLTLTLYAGREFDGCHQYEDIYETFHIHKDSISKILGRNFVMPTDDATQKKLVRKLQQKRLDYLRIKYE